MEYRKFNKFDKPVSLFGIGCMRFPMIQTGDGAVVDEEQSIQMIRYGIDHGVNYIDTAYPYHNGESELIVAKALKNGYRDRTYLATKLPVWLVEKYDDMERFLDIQLNKLETDCIDFYLLHALNKSRWDSLMELKVLDFMEKAKANGKIKYICFSFHDNNKTFKEIINAYDWDMCQIQMNIMDMDEQATVEGLKYAGDKNIPVVIMEPLKGGKLANRVPDEIGQIYGQSRIKRTPVEWAFRWLYNFPQVAVILSGVSSMEQLKDNLRIFNDAKANCMDEEELALIEQVRQAYLKGIKIPCTGCEYCLPCPQRVSIPRIFDLVNSAFMYMSEKDSKNNYQRFIVNDGNDASKCVECGQCENVCPQNIPIMQKLKESHIFLTGQGDFPDN
ncbi:MAG: aldo/keto reductase [Bacillota bacterium]|jgi:predicted aldo/keto reductase-like oxidoreductase|nr:aldo/keto reductase [Bacillota bacterium]NLV62801.1 aldo/keto reductase [Clostridiaceae bacterium]